MPLGEKELKLRNEISKEQDERIFAATKEFMELAHRLGIESVEVGGIKIVNGNRSKDSPAQNGEEMLTISREHAQELIDKGVLEYKDPLDQDPYADPDLYASAEGGTPLNGGV